MSLLSSAASRLAIAGLFAWLCVFAPAVVAAPPSTDQPQGLRRNLPAWYALTGAKVVTATGAVLDDTVVVVRDGVIVQLGGEAPAGAKQIELAGRRIYPGLIDAYSETAAPEAAWKSGAVYWNNQVRAHVSVANFLPADASTNEAYRSQGIVARLVAPSAGILRGQSAVTTTGEAGRDRRILRAGAAQHALLSLRRSSRDHYPNSPMGAVALARQAMLDAKWLRDAQQANQADPKLPRVERNDTLAALAESFDGLPMMFETLNELYLLRADRFAREFAVPAIMLGSGHEYKRLEAIASTGRPIIVPLNFPKAPNVATYETERQATLEELMHWDIAPENPARLHDAGATIALTAYGLKSPKDFLKQVRIAVKRGLPAEAALRAMTTTPAKLLGVEHELGEIAPGKQASFVIVHGDLLKDGKVQETWVDGQRHIQDEAPWFDLAGAWETKLGREAWRLELKTAPKLSGEATATTSGKPSPPRGGKDKPKGKPDSGDEKDDEEDDEKDDETQQKLELKNLSLSGARLSFQFEGKPFAHPGVARVSALMDADGKRWSGQIVWSDHSTMPITATRIDDPEGADDATDDEDATEASPGEQDAESEDASQSVAGASFDVNYPLGAFGRAQAPEAANVLLANATIWTCGPAGVIERGSVWIRDGRIRAVYPEAMPGDLPKKVRVIDLQGQHLSPGIIDCHSHMATDGGVNESAQSITAEVRIGDFINCDDINIYRQLAGGVTASNILHGSANPIGGQNQVIKLRWGALDEAMKFAEAPGGIKFALGENVKQSNWGETYTTRYPQTRMGVVEIMKDALQAAQEHRAAQRRFEQRGGMPVRRDLELEALAEILEHRRWIHCHSYRQDEILALIRTLDEFGVTIGTFQHILEGYKVADAMAKHGAMGSAFSDWWAYKFEVYDAIPYNGALMHQAGVVVSFNSDDRELARRLNLEAAKAMKYGKIPAEEALKFVTLNPAKQLRIDKHVGSIEVGKHADLAVWSRSPLSSFTRCEQTWVDGRKYFDRAEDQQAQEAAAAQRQQLVHKILNSGSPMLKPGERHPDPAALWPQRDEFCHHSHGAGRGGLGRQHQHQTK